MISSSGGMTSALQPHPSQGCDTWLMQPGWLHGSRGGCFGGFGAMSIIALESCLRFLSSFTFRWSGREAISSIFFSLLSFLILASAL